jgi:ribosome biogenesis GTPase
MLVNALAAEDMSAVRERLSDGRTGVLVGPSGAGKSTIINALLGEERQRTREVREADGRGRHTTVTRELVGLPSGGSLIDTPGLRALGMTGSEEGIGSAFPEIERLGADCHFRDCGHADEPGCAVRAAVESGELPAERLESYHKLIREARFEARKSDARAQAEEERIWKTRHKELKDFYKRTGGRPKR